MKCIHDASTVPPREYAGYTPPPLSGTRRDTPDMLGMSHAARRAHRGCDRPTAVDERNEGHPATSTSKGKRRHVSKNTVTPYVAHGCREGKWGVRGVVKTAKGVAEHKSTRKRGFLSRIFDFFKGNR